MLSIFQRKTAFDISVRGPEELIKEIKSQIENMNSSKLKVLNSNSFRDPNKQGFDLTSWVALGLSVYSVFFEPLAVVIKKALSKTNCSYIELRTPVGTKRFEVKHGENIDAVIQEIKDFLMTGK